MGRVEGKVAFITGAARGVGRSHAVRLAEEGADIIAVDIGEPIDATPGVGATAEELTETERQVQALGRRIITRKTDVRDLDGLSAAVAAGVAEFGRLDVVSVNAGISGMPSQLHEMPRSSWQDVIDINLTGAWLTTKATVPYLIQGGGGAVVFTNSTLGLQGSATMGHYVSSKHGVMGLMKSLAKELAQHAIRVNAILPTGVATPMLLNDDVYRVLKPGIQDPTMDDVVSVSGEMNLLPIPWVEALDVSNALLFLASDEARYITGVGLPVDAGALIK